MWGIWAVVFAMSVGNCLGWDVPANQPEEQDLLLGREEVCAPSLGHRENGVGEEARNSCVFRLVALSQGQSENMRIRGTQRGSSVRWFLFQQEKWKSGAMAAGLWLRSPEGRSPPAWYERGTIDFGLLDFYLCLFILWEKKLSNSYISSGAVGPILFFPNMVKCLIGNEGEKREDFILSHKIPNLGDC